MDPITALRIIFGIASGVASYKSYKKAKKLEKEANQILLQKYGTGGGIPVAYGTRRVAGTVLYANTINNRELFVVYALSIGEIENISNIQIGNRSVADRSVFDHYIQRNSNYYGSTQQEIDNILSNQDPPNKPRMVFNCHLGGADQVADPMLVGCISEWTSAHRLRGIAYIAANFDYDSGGGMFTGFPEITCDVQGKKLYDPRKDSTVTNGSGSHRIDNPSTYEFTDNSALVLLDYLTNSEYGKSLPTSAIDMQSFMDSADKNTTQQTINYSATIQRLSTSDDTLRFEKNTTNKNIMNALKVGNTITVKIGETTYASGTVLGKVFNSRFDEQEKDYRDSNPTYIVDYDNLYIIQLSSGAVTTDIEFNPTPTSISITTTQDRFPFNGVIDTELSLFENTKKILGNMRGIFNYTNGIYSLKIEDSESVALSIDDDDILESGITVSIENKEEKYNIVEVEFANAQTNYELDTIAFKHTSETQGEDYTYDDGGEELKLSYEMPYITNVNIAYQNAQAVLKRSRNNKSISFTGTHKLLFVKVGEVISVTNSQLGMSSEQYRITKMTINHDLTVNVEAIIYQSDIYGYVTPPTENIDIPDDLVDSFKVDTPTNVNFIDKDPSTGIQPYLEWDNPTTYPAYEFRVVVKDSNSNVKYDGRTKNTFFNLTGIEVDTGYTAEIRSLNTNYVESPPATYNFNNSVPPVQNGDLGDNSVTDAKVADISADKIDTGVLNLGTESGMAVRQAKTGYTDTTTGFWLGNDSGTPKFNIGTSSSYFKFDGSSVDIAGDLTATNLTIDANATINGTLDASVIRLDGQDLSTLIGFGATSPNASGDYFNFTGKVDFSDDVVFDDFATFYNSVTFSDGWQGQGIFDIDQGALEFGSYTPSSTTNRLYNVSGTLYWNGSQVGVGAVNSVTNMVDNRVITASGSNSINGEANLTFDGTTLNVTGDQVITGNLTVQGTTTTIDTTNLDVKDKNITLNYGTGDTSANANGAGITIQDAVSATEDATILWDTTNDRFDFSHGITLPDNGKAIFGAGSDLQIYHDGTHSYIDDAGTGDLRIKTNFFRVRNTGDTYNMIIADQSGAVTLYNNGNTKLATTSTGIDVTGEGKFTDLTNGGLVHARGLDASLFLDVTSGNNAKIYYDSGDLEFKATNPTAVDSSVSMKIAQNRDISFYEDTGTTAKLFWDASAEQLDIGDQHISQSSISSGDSTTSGNVRSYFSDGAYTDLKGYGLEFNRTTSYIRPTVDGTMTLNIGGFDASLDWNSIRFRSVNGLYMTGTQFLTTDRNLVNIGSISSSGAIISTNSGNRFDALSIGDDSDIYLYEGSTNVLNIRTGASGSYKYFTFQDDGYFNTNSGGISTGGTARITSTGNLTNIGTISSGGITSSGDIQSDKFKGNTYSSNSFLDFDDDSGVLDADNTTTLASISAMHFIIDTNANGSADKFYWLKDNVSPLSATTLMDLDKNANLVLRNGTVTGQSGGFFGGDLEVYNSSDLIIGTGGTFKFGTTVIVDASRNLTNIGTISSGNITSSGTLTTQADSASAGISIKRTNSSTAGAKGHIGFRDSDGYFVASIDSIGTGVNNSGNLRFFTSTGQSYTGAYSNPSATLILGTDNSATFSGTISSGAISIANSTASTTLLTVGSSSQTGYSLQNFQTDTLSGNTAYLIAYGSGNAQDGNFAMKNTNTGGNIFFQVGTAIPLTLTTTGSTFTGTISSGNIDIDTTNPQLTFRPDDSILFRLRVDESANRLELGHSSNKNLYLSNTGDATFNYDLNVSGDLDVTGTISTTSFSADSLSTDTLTTDDVIYQTGSTNVATKGMRTATTTATTETAVVSISTGFTSVKFLVQITNTTNPAYHVTEITLLNDGTNQYISEYGTILTGSALATFDADKTATNLRLLATPTTTDTLEFKIMYNAIYS